MLSSPFEKELPLEKVEIYLNFKRFFKLELMQLRKSSFPSHIIIDFSFPTRQPFGIPKGLLKKVTRLLETPWNSKGHSKSVYTSFGARIEILNVHLKQTAKIVWNALGRTFKKVI
jgi:hypothetical protein